MLADGELSPISAPWVLVNTLRSGYLTSCGKDGDSFRVTINDSYQDEYVQVDVWLSDDNMPTYAEFLWRGHRILSLNVDAFTIV